MDMENGSSATCRICFDSDGDNLIAPCLCRGTQKFVHRQCLDSWRTAQEGFAFAHCTTCKARFQFEIMDEFDDFDHNFITGMKATLLLLQDLHMECFVAVYLIAGLSSFVYLMDIQGVIRNKFDLFDLFSKSPFLFYCSMGSLCLFILFGFSFIMPRYINLCLNDWRVLFFTRCCLALCVMGLFPVSIVFVPILAVFALCGIAHCSYATCTAVQYRWQAIYLHLSMGDLSKVYVVKDRRGYYTSQVLDPFHERRLRALRLL